MMAHNIQYKLKQHKCAYKAKSNVERTHINMTYIHLHQSRQYILDENTLYYTHHSYRLQKDNKLSYLRPTINIYHCGVHCNVFFYRIGNK